MNTEELLKPRYKVILDYPGSIYEIGSLIHLNGYEDINEQWLCKYPTIFKKIEWWQDRDEKDMPEYIKPIMAQQYVFKVYTVVGDSINFENRNGGFSIEKLSVFLPATKEEYERRFI